MLFGLSGTCSVSSLGSGPRGIIANLILCRILVRETEYC